uniref:C3H1-type domain-containing protein n=1 Tax=Brassica oleracea var. oleracea TaxID=109376 RepID=A0A0D3BBV0_BRAOL
MELLGQPACGNFKAYGFCKYGARCKFDHPVTCAPLVSTHVRITSPPSRSDSITASNGDKSAAENQTSENEKQDDGPDKTEVQDSSKLSHSDSTALSNDAEYTSSEAKKGGDDPSAPDNSRGNDSSDNAAGS